ncbi:Odorant receptor 5 [Ephemera danica]|nr:Odorant receptor 5 [Ephemera danica]
MKFSIDFERILMWPQIPLKIFGLWNANSSKFTLFLLRTALTFIVLSIILNTIVLIINADKNLISISIVANGIRFVAWIQRIIFFLTKRQAMVDLLSQYFHDISAPANFRRQIDRFRLKTSKLMSKTYVMRYFFAILLIVSITLYEELDVSSIPMIFIYFIVRLLFILLHVQILGFNLMYITWLQLTLCLLEHMNEIVRTLHCTRNGLGPQKWNSAHQARIKKTLRYTIQLHQRAAKFVCGLNQMFSNVMMMDLWSTHVVFSIAFVQIAIEGMLHNIATSLATVMSTLLIYFYMALICQTSTDIVEQSGRKLQDNLCHVPWWGWNQSNLNIRNGIYSSSMHGLQIKAGPIYNFSLATFATVLSVSFYYFMILYELNTTRI